MSQIYADEVIPPRAADSRGQNKTNAEDAGSDWDFLELNGEAASEHSSTMPVSYTHLTLPTKSSV